MIRTSDNQGGARGGATTGAGGRPPVPPDVDLVTADEGPMRDELKRQIAALETELAQFIVDNCPYEELPSLVQRGPAVLTTEQLEFVRDELLQLQADLHDRLVTRMNARIEVEPPEPEPEIVGLFERLRRRLRRLPSHD